MLPAGNTNVSGWSGRTNGVGEIVIRIRIASAIHRVITRIHESAPAGFHGLVAHDEELGFGQRAPAQENQEACERAKQVLVHAHDDVQRWNRMGVVFVAPEQVLHGELCALCIRIIR